MSDEAGLPKATVNKVIKDCLPGELKIASEVRDIVADASLGSYWDLPANYWCLNWSN